MIKINRQETLTFLVGYIIALLLFEIYVWDVYRLNIIGFLLLAIVGIMIALLYGHLTYREEDQ